MIATSFQLLLPKQNLEFWFAGFNVAADSVFIEFCHFFVADIVEDTLTKHAAPSGRSK